MTRPAERLLQEVSYIAYHFHWPPRDILTMPHAERLAWVRQIGQINTRLGERR